MDRGTEFSRARRLSASVGLCREGSKSAITSHENCCRAERSAHGSLVQNIFVRSIDQLMATTHASICRCLNIVHCIGRMREGEATSRTVDEAGQFFRASPDVLGDRPPDPSLAACIAGNFTLALELIESRISFRQGLVRPRARIMCRVSSTR